jgi:hypothetical protein
VEAVGDLFGLWSSLTRCVSVEPVTITGDQLDTGSRSQPPRDTNCRAIRQDVEHRPVLKVDHDRAKVTAPLRRPFVESDYPRRRMVGQILVPYEMAQNSGSTARKAQAAGEPFARPATDPVTKQAQNAGRTLCPSTTGICYSWQSLGEDGLPAFNVSTVPSTNRKRDLHWSALDRQIPQPSLIRAVPGRRDDLTSRTCRTGAELLRFDNPDAINQRR